MSFVFPTPDKYHPPFSVISFQRNRVKPNFSHHTLKMKMLLVSAIVLIKTKSVLMNYVYFD